MTSATTLHLGLLECCSAATIPRTQLTTSISKPSCPLLSTKQIQSFTPLKSKNSRFTIVPLVAQTSDLAEQKEGDGESAIGYASDEGVVASSWESSEELVESDGGEESLVQPSEEAKLFVGNLPYDVDSVKLAQLFDPAGIVEVCEVIYNRQTNQSRGFGFVTMSTVEEAEKAVEMFKGYEINGRPLTVNKAAPKGSQVERIPRTYEPSFRMYVGNLPWQLDNARLVEVFSEHGKVVDARVVYDRESGRSRGFGFVTMATETELNDAIAALDGQNLDGRAIRVNVAEEKPKLSFL